MIGRRRPNRPDGGYARPQMDGDFARLLPPLTDKLSERMRWWDVTAPDGSGCVLSPKIHTVVEHDDGTITVTPSIVTSTWHGWLTAGVWKSV